jgi:hypothetical protein
MDKGKEAIARASYATEICAKHTPEHLREWAQNILTTPYEDAAVMVAEDPTVLDVCAAYILLSEAQAEVAIKERDEAKRLLGELWKHGPDYQSGAWTVGEQVRAFLGSANE